MRGTVLARRDKVWLGLHISVTNRSAVLLISEEDPTITRNRSSSSTQAPFLVRDTTIVFFLILITGKWYQ